VGFAGPHEALEAFAKMDGQIFGGKLLHVLAGDSQRKTANSEGKSSSSFKKHRDEELRQRAHVGNALYVNTDTAAGEKEERRKKKEKEEEKRKRRNMVHWNESEIT
jgi:hypothetical protein